MNKRRAVWLRDDQWELTDAILSVSGSNLTFDARITPKPLNQVAGDWCATRIAEIRDAIGARK